MVDHTDYLIEAKSAIVLSQVSLPLLAQSGLCQREYVSLCVS